KTASIKGKTTFCSSPPQFGLSPVGDVASAVENAWAAYSGTIAAPHEYFDQTGNLAKGDPRTLDGDTIFKIGSVTKVFTSLVLADMVSRKEVTLDDPAAKYLPENVKMPERSGKCISLLDLSTHSSGLPPLPNLKPNDPRNPYVGHSVDDLYQF